MSAVKTGRVISSHPSPVNEDVSYAATAADTFTSYSLSMRSSVIVLKALPAMLTKSNVRFILRGMPSEKQANSSRMYSLSVGVPGQRD